MKVLVGGPPGVVGTFFSAMHSLCHRARRTDFYFLDLRLWPVTDFGAAPPTLLVFCFLAIFSASFRLPFRVVTLAARATNYASLLDNDPQMWLLIWYRYVYLPSAKFKILSLASKGVGISYSSWAS